MSARYPFNSFPAVYVDPAVVNFTADPAIAEIGSTVNNVVLRWDLSKTALVLKFEGVEVPPNVTSVAAGGVMTTDQVWTLSMGDDEKAVSKRATLKFLNKAYWGNVAVAPASSADILALPDSEFANANFKKTIQHGSPNGTFPCLAYPVRFGPLRHVKIGVPNTVITPPVIWSDFTDYTVTTVSFTNASGYTEDYLVTTFNAARNDSSLLVEWD